MNSFVNIVLRLLNLLTLAIARWAGKQWSNYADLKKRQKVAEQALSEIAPYGATKQELEQAFDEIVNGAAPAAVIAQYQQLAQSRNAS